MSGFVQDQVRHTPHRHPRPLMPSSLGSFAATDCLQTSQPLGDASRHVPPSKPSYTPSTVSSYIDGLTHLQYALHDIGLTAKGIQVLQDRVNKVFEGLGMVSFIFHLVHFLSFSVVRGPLASHVTRPSLHAFYGLGR